MAVANGSTVRWFHSGMAGAPQINGVQNGVIEVLSACLVDGFGTATPDGDKITVSGGVATVDFSGGHDFEKYAVVEITGATPSGLNDVWRVTGATATSFTFDCPGIADGMATGSISVKRATPGYWTKPYTSTNKAAFRSTHPDGTGIYLRVNADAGSLASAFVRGAYAMTGIEDLTQLFPTDSQETSLLWSGSVYPTSGDKPWLVVADERFFYLSIRSSLSGTRGGGFHHFGDYISLASSDPLGCVLAAQAVSSATSQYSGTDTHRGNPAYSTGCWIAGGIDGVTQEALDYGRSSASTGSSSGYIGGDQSFPHPVTNGHFFYGPALVMERASMLQRGHLPGFMVSAVGDEGVLGVPGSVNDHFIIVPPDNPEDRVRALVSLNFASSTNGGIAIDIEGPWR